MMPSDPKGSVLYADPLGYLMDGLVITIHQSTTAHVCYNMTSLQGINCLKSWLHYLGRDVVSLKKK